MISGVAWVALVGINIGAIYVWWLDSWSGCDHWAEERKQYKVTQGDVIQIEKLEGKVGDKVTLDQILMIGEDDQVDIGSPMVQGRQVTAEIIDQGKGKKILVFKKIRRKKYRRKTGTGS